MHIRFGWSGMCAAGILGCASGPVVSGATENHGFQNGNQVWVRGPWKAIAPSTDVDEIIDRLCPAIMQLDGASLRDYGQEYCGAIYSLGDGNYYTSIPSPLGKTVLVGPAKRKQCIPPRTVKDDRGKTSVLGDFHSHPWSPSPMSFEDRMARTQIWSIRIQFDTTCLIQKYVPSESNDRPGEVYERRDKAWKLVGLVKPEDKEYGIVTAVAEDG
ncbi:hypothetical protein [Melittangium boletus]|uniref:JAB domain-containing protein n=1 Tax=Melittangium boletus DSM 14713 TaxID=1294270 RepID=A0A250IGJ1_9BACT|nr:hypothetical protein [Melittangium boletus]ATB30885.1 hypothetical protein MEBOL_004347 [Melittangium boletus DSM 14713]